MTALILTLIGDDRPGLVESIAQAVADHDGNWVESSLSRLSGKFAGVVRVTVTDDRAQPLADALRAHAEAGGLRVAVEAAEDDGQATGDRIGGMRLEVIGLDRAGIVRDVAAALARHGVNVTAFDSRVFNAPMSGERMFRADARLNAPEGLDTTALHDALDAVAEALDVEIHLDEHPPADE